MISLSELMTHCDANGIRLIPSDDGGLTVDAPQEALTPDLMRGLRDHKDELLAALLLPVSPPLAPREMMEDASVEPVCRCGSTAWRDVPMHDGQSVRRDCGRCERFIEFRLWHGKILYT